jgi:transposase
MAELLGLAGVEVDAVEREVDGSWTVHVVTAPGARACCPGCGREAHRAKELTVHAMRHLVVLPVRVTWHKKKFWCDDDACEQAVFREGGPLVGRGGVVSEPAKETMGHLVGDWLVPVDRVAGAVGVSWRTAHDGFVQVAAEAQIVVTETEPDGGTETEPDGGTNQDVQVEPDDVVEPGGNQSDDSGVRSDPGEPAPAAGGPAGRRRARRRRSVSGLLPLVKALGLDDHRRGKPLYHLDPATNQWVADADRWQTVFVDSDGGHGLLGQAEGRAAAEVAAWLAAQARAWRENIEYVTIDMSTVYKSAARAALPNAVLCVDFFHVSQLANKMIGDVRRRVTYERYGRRGRATDPEYTVKGLLVRGEERLSAKARGKLLCALAGLGDAGRQLTAAWKAKELLRRVLALSPTRTGRATCRSQVAAALERFFSYCATTGATVPEVVTLAETVSAWREEIAAAVLSGCSNAAAEGVNRLIKLVYRTAFGFTNVTNQQRRSRYAASRSTRPRWLHNVTLKVSQPVAA